MQLLIFLFELQLKRVSYIFLSSLHINITSSCKAPLLYVYLYVCMHTCIYVVVVATDDGAAESDMTG